MEPINIHKFGGGVLKDADSFPQLLKIVSEEKPQIIVVSAIGKTTNVLKDAAEGLILRDKNMIEDAFARFANIFYPIIKKFISLYGEEACMLLTERFNHYTNFLEGFFTKKSLSALSLMTTDRILVVGELISSEFISWYLTQNSFKNKLRHAKEFIRTDMNFGAANVLKEESMKLLTSAPSTLMYSLTNGTPVVTQGFVGFSKTAEDDFAFSGPTTLGREGSDYTAALIANMLAKLKYPGFAPVAKVVLWKNVNGVAHDPNKTNENDHYFDLLSYSEFNEKIQFGGTAEGLVHPKTVKELEEVNVPLWIRNFNHPEMHGTFIG